MLEPRTWGQLVAADDFELVAERAARGDDRAYALLVRRYPLKRVPEFRIDMFAAKGGAW